MPTRGPDEGIGAAVGEVAGHARSIVRLELKLALAEVKEKLGAIGVAVGLGVGVAILGLLALSFATATLAAALATALPTWLALLIVTLVLALLGGACALLALQALRRATPPIPRQAIEDVRLTTQAVTHDGGYRI